MGPWLGKNIIDTGNPVYPLGYSVFGGRHWDRDQDAKWWRAHGPRRVAWEDLAGSFLDVAARSDWQSPLYVALAPLALLRRDRRGLVVALWGYVLYLFLTWWLLTHRVDRFWIPLLPILAILSGVGADWTRSRVWSMILITVLGVSIVSNAANDSSVLCGNNQWTDDLSTLRTTIPELINEPLAKLENTVLPPGAKVLLVGQAAVFFFDRPMIYNTVFNHETIETIARDRSPEQVRQSLRERGITHVYVDWQEIDRYRAPDHYGFTEFVTPNLFAGFVKAGALRPPLSIGLQHELYAVR